MKVAFDLTRNFFLPSTCHQILGPVCRKELAAHLGAKGYRVDACLLHRDAAMVTFGFGDSHSG